MSAETVTTITARAAAEPEFHTRLFVDPAVALAGSDLIEAAPSRLVTDPVCQMEFPAESAAACFKFNGQTYYFCHVVCLRLFAADPLAYLAGCEEED